MARRRDRSKDKEKAADCFERGFGAQAPTPYVIANVVRMASPSHNHHPHSTHADDNAEYAQCAMSR